MPDLSVEFAGIKLANPVLASAGTFGYGIEFAESVRLNELGGIIIKTLTFRPRLGNPPPRLAETPSGMLNAVGLQNVGYEAFISEKLPKLKPFNVPIIVSVQAQDADELTQMVRALEGEPQIAGIELNLSCPNVRHSEAPEDFAVGPVQLVSQDTAKVGQLTSAARSVTRKSLWAKLSPESENLIPAAQAAERAGADSVSLVNTFVGMSLDVETRKSRLGNLTGGLSGPAIRPLALYRVWYTAQNISIPVLGMGGIAHAEDALEFFLAGARAVAVGTAHFADPDRIRKIIKGIDRYMERHSIRSVTEIIGAMQR